MIAIISTILVIIGHLICGYTALVILLTLIRLGLYKPNGDLTETKIILLVLGSIGLAWPILILLGKIFGLWMRGLMKLAGFLEKLILND